MVKDAQKFAEELGMDLKLQHPDPTGHTAEGKRIDTPRIVDHSRKRCKAIVIEIESEKLQG